MMGQMDRPRKSGSSSPGLDEDEADEVPYSHSQSIDEPSPLSPLFPQRPPPGGLFPSETRLNDQAMYRRHSRTASESGEASPIGFGKDEEPYMRFPVDPDRGETRGTLESAAASIGDDRAFTAIAIDAAATFPAVDVVAGKIDEPEDMDYEVVPSPFSKEVVDQTDDHARGNSFKHRGSGSTQERSDSLRDIKPSPLIIQPPPKAFLETEKAKYDGDVFVGGTALGYLKPDQPPSKTKEKLQTKSPVSKPVPSTEVRNSSWLSPPTTTLVRRSKSRKEIVEEAIADSMGNHPERGVMPGFWPTTPGDEFQDDRIF
jgi:hypothetical protein